MGTALLALAPLAIFHELRGSRVLEGEFGLTVVFIVLATGSYHLVYLAVFTAQGDAGSWLAALSQVVLPTAFLNVLLLLPIYALIWSASGALRRPAYA